MKPTTLQLKLNEIRRELEAIQAAVEVATGPAPSQPAPNKAPEPIAKLLVRMSPLAVRGREREAGDQFNELTIRNVLQMDVSGLRALLCTLAVNCPGWNLSNFDQDNFIRHLSEAEEILYRAETEGQ